MKSYVDESEVNRIPVDMIGLTLSKLPYDSQDAEDRLLAEHFLLRKAGSNIGSRLRKIEDKLKESFIASGKENVVMLTKNYRRELNRGTAREVFDQDKFMQLICQKYPDVLPHVLRELATEAKKTTNPPTEIEVEYIGDVTRQEG